MMIPAMMATHTHMGSGPILRVKTFSLPFGLPPGDGLPGRAARSGACSLTASPRALCGQRGYLRVRYRVQRGETLVNRLGRPGCGALRVPVRHHDGLSQQLGAVREMFLKVLRRALQLSERADETHRAGL